MFVHIHTKTTNLRKGGYQHGSGGCMLAGIRRAAGRPGGRKERESDVILLILKH